MIRPALSLLWKEYREQRWFLLAALSVFCGFPLIEATGRYFSPPHPSRAPAEFASDSAAALVLGCGALLAIFVAVGSTTRDLRHELHTFWRSRPVGVTAWFTTKYLLGLLVVLVACTVPLVMQFAMAYFSEYRYVATARDAGAALGLNTFAVILIFSVAFLLGCLVRHATQAALLSLAAALLIYFLPLAVAPLAPLSVASHINDQVVLLDRFIPNPSAGRTYALPLPTRWHLQVRPDLIPFAATMLLASAAATATALLAVRRDWTLPTSRQAMHWSLGSVATLLFAATAFQVGSNIQPKHQFDRPLPKYGVVNLAFDGTRGVLMLRDLTGHRYNGDTTVKLCSLEMTPDGPRFGPAIAPKDGVNIPVPWEPAITFWRPQHPDRAHLLAQRYEFVDRDVRSHLEVASTQLLTLDLTGAAPDPVLHRLDLADHLPAKFHATAHQLQGTLLVDGDDRTLVIDLDHPDAPTVSRVLTKRPLPNSPPRAPVYSSELQLQTHTDPAGRERIEIAFPWVDGLPPRDALAATLALRQRGWGQLANDRFLLSGDLLVRAEHNRGIATYRLTSLHADRATFELLGRHAYSPLQRFLGYGASQLSIIGHHLYVTGKGLSAYDLSDPAHPRPAGHFALRDSAHTKLAPLPTGDLLLATKHLYVLPPTKDAR